MTAERLAGLDKNDILLLDIRSAEAYAAGHIGGAVSVPDFDAEKADLPAGKTIVLCCKNGLRSAEEAHVLVSRGYTAEAVEGGYAGWLRFGGDRGRLAEDLIRGEMKRCLFTPFAKAINEYHLLESGDRVAVCMSGGKDSMLMAMLFRELKRHRKFDFSLKFLVMDPGYRPSDRAALEENARTLGIPIEVFASDIFADVEHVEKSPCYLCARMRRGHLYAKARELGCNKIALGHHYDDVIETILMGMLYGGQVQTMMPRIDSANFAGMQLIRPMYLVREADIVRWQDRCGLKFLRCACRFTAEQSRCGEGEERSKRARVKRLIRTLALEDPEIEQNIFKSVENVNLATVIAYKDADGTRHSNVR